MRPDLCSPAQDSIAQTREFVMHTTRPRIRFGSAPLRLPHLSFGG
jgi:hypothetical protein